MELSKLMEIQRDFDKRHGWDWSESDEKERIENLKYLSIALAGEVGEFCNLVKKIVRKFKSKGKYPSEEDWEKLKEEFVDIFIYILKGAAELFKMDLEQEYIRKKNLNEKRFKEFEVKQFKEEGE